MTKSPAVARDTLRFGVSLLPALDVPAVRARAMAAEEHPGAGSPGERHRRAHRRRQTVHIGPEVRPVHGVHEPGTVEKAVADIAGMPRAKIVGDTRGLMKFVVERAAGRDLPAPVVDGGVQ